MVSRLVGTDGAESSRGPLARTPSEKYEDEKQKRKEQEPSAANSPGRKAVQVCQLHPPEDWPILCGCR